MLYVKATNPGGERATWRMLGGVLPISELLWSDSEFNPMGKCKRNLSSGDRSFHPDIRAIDANVADAISGVLEIQ
jgi:hypothetical protein